jgi:cytochrome o ubiquinol oxidase operon protein cyoD
MSHTSHDAGKDMKAYVVGFVLSILFTLIPYYMVVHHTATGSALLAAILSFAVVQMLIQVTFFLHLGRGQKPKWNLYFFISTIGIILVVVGGSIMIINNLHYNMTPDDQTKKIISDEGIYQISGEKTGACQSTKVNHKVTIISGQATPRHTVAAKCDTLTFIAEDGASHKVTFGTYTQVTPYVGETTLVVQKNHSQTITLSEPGTYQFYDQLQPELSGDFAVSQ